MMTVRWNLKSRSGSFFNSCVHNFRQPLQPDSQDSKNYTSKFLMLQVASWTIAWRHFRLTSSFIGCWKFRFQIFLLHQKIRRDISGGVFRAIFDFWPHLVVDIFNFEPFVTRVTDMDTIVNYINVDDEGWKGFILVTGSILNRQNRNFVSFKFWLFDLPCYWTNLENP